MDALLKFITFAEPWIWLFLSVLFGVIEALTATLTSVWFSAAAFVMIFLSFLPIPFHFQILCFAVLSLAFFIFTRPFAVKKLKVRGEKLNADAIVGKRLSVTGDISLENKGSVRFNGLEWSAKSADGSFIKSGEECIVEKIEGVTAVVRKIQEA